MVGALTVAVGNVTVSPGPTRKGFAGETFDCTILRFSSAGQPGGLLATATLREVTVIGTGLGLKMRSGISSAGPPG